MSNHNSKERKELNNILFVYAHLEPKSFNRHQKIWKFLSLQVKDRRLGNRLMRHEFQEHCL